MYNSREGFNVFHCGASEGKKKEKENVNITVKRKERDLFPTFSPFSHVFDCRSCLLCRGCRCRGRRKTTVGVLQNPGPQKPTPACKCSAAGPSPEPPSAMFCLLCKCNRTRHSNGEKQNKNRTKKTFTGNFLGVFCAFLCSSSR